MLCKQGAAVTPGEGEEGGPDVINGSLVAKRCVYALLEWTEAHMVQDEVSLCSTPSLSVGLQAECY